MSAGNSKRVQWLDMLRGIAMVCVVFGHMDTVPSDIEVWIYSFHMPLFFLISGATFRYERYTSLKECIAGQAKKLLLPYLVMYIVCSPFWYLNHVVLGSTSSEKVLRLIPGLFIANSDLMSMSNGALWFLPVLFFTTVLFWWLTDLDRCGKIDIAASMGTCLLIGLLLSTFIDVHLPWSIDNVPMATVFYYLGHVAMTSYYSHRDTIDQLPSFAVFAIAAVLLTLGTWAAFSNDKISAFDNRYNVMFLAFISSLGISGGLTFILMRLPNIRVLSFIGRNTMSFLGYHIPVMRFLENWDVTAGYCSAHPLWEGAAVVLLCLPISYLIERFAPFLAGKIRSKKPSLSQNNSVSAA